MSEPKRLFFAIELPLTPSGKSFTGARRLSGRCRRPVAADNLHLTLAFLGEVSADKQRALAALAGRIRQPGFTLTLDDAGQWLRSRVVWLGTRQPPRGLLQLASCAQAAQRLLSKPAAVSSAYHPAARCPPRGADPPPGFQLDVSVNEFVLYESSFPADAPLHGAGTLSL
jgi:2'-5' RNA ligase